MEGFRANRADANLLNHTQLNASPIVPRSAKLSRNHGYWFTRAGSRAGVYFGKIGEVSFAEAQREFRKYLASLNERRVVTTLPSLSVAEVCDAHLVWAKEERSESLFGQRRSILEHFSSHRIEAFRDEELTGHGKQIAMLRATDLKRRHVEQYLQHRATTPSKKTGKPVGDKSLRHIAVALKACWNWAADSIEDGGGGLLPEDHRPLAKLPRGYVSPKDLTEADLPTDEEVKALLKWAAVEPSQLQIKRGVWRPREGEELQTHDARIFADLLVLYHATGARTSELCQAQVRDFMPRTRQIVLGKHKRSRTQHNPTLRRIQIGKKAAEILRRVASGKATDAPLFDREDGSAWNLDQVVRRFKKTIKLASDKGDPVRDHLTAYSFRDLYISELLMVGIEPFKVAKMAGTSMRDIERSYGHFFEADLASAHEALEASRAERVA